MDILKSYVLALRNQKLRYFDWEGQVHLPKVKTGGQQGDPLEMLKFNLTIHHVWGRVLSKFPHDRVVPYVDDGYMKTTLSVVFQVLTELTEHHTINPHTESRFCTELSI